MRLYLETFKDMALRLVCSLCCFCAFRFSMFFMINGFVAALSLVWNVKDLGTILSAARSRYGLVFVGTVIGSDTELARYNFRGSCLSSHQLLLSIFLSPLRQKKKKSRKKELKFKRNSRTTKVP